MQTLPTYLPLIVSLRHPQSIYHFLNLTAESDHSPERATPNAEEGYFVYSTRPSRGKAGAHRLRYKAASESSSLRFETGTEALLWLLFSSTGCDESSPCKADNGSLIHVCESCAIETMPRGFCLDGAGSSRVLNQSEKPSPCKARVSDDGYM